EVEKRLAEITTDVSKISVTQRVELTSLTLPRVANNPKAGTYKYKMTIASPKKQDVWDDSVVIKEENGSWVVTDTVKNGPAAVTDASTLDKSTLAIRKRVVQGNPVTIEVNFTNEVATGKLLMQSNAQPFTAPVPGPLFPAGIPQLIGCLPLADGYSL